jgi:hypothetical protein
MIIREHNTHHFRCQKKLGCDASPTQFFYLDKMSKRGRIYWNITGTNFYQILFSEAEEAFLFMSDECLH